MTMIAGRAHAHERKIVTILFYNNKLAIFAALTSTIHYQLPTNSCVELKNADPNDCPRQCLIPEQHLSGTIGPPSMFREGVGLQGTISCARAHSDRLGAMVRCLFSMTTSLPIMGSLTEK